MINSQNKSSNIKIILSIIIILVIGGIIYFSDKLAPISQQNQDQINQQTPSSVILAPQNIQNLGNHICLAGFTVRNREKIPTNLNLSNLKLEYFESFGSGAFYGKIKNYQSEMNKDLPNLLNQLMMEHKIPTYEHLEANVCLYYQDLLNPIGGGGYFNYYVEHYYCTNSCQTGNYEIKVDLDPSGKFVGYREGNPFK